MFPKSGDHNFQFALYHSPKEDSYHQKCKVRDYSHFSQAAFNNDLLQIDCETRNSADKSFSCSYNKLNKLVGKHAPLKAILRRKAKQLAKLWITRGLRKSIKIKNALFRAGNTVNYKLYKNNISSLARLSKKLHYIVNKRHQKPHDTSPLNHRSLL